MTTAPDRFIGARRQLVLRRALRSSPSLADSHPQPSVDIRVIVPDNSPMRRFISAKSRKDGPIGAGRCRLR
jgi:hypothetical protein